MSELRLDDWFTTHPKVIALSDAAFRFYVTALSLRAQREAGPRVPFAEMVALVPFSKVKTRRVLLELDARGLCFLNEAGMLEVVAIPRVQFGPSTKPRALWHRVRRALAPLIFARDGYRCGYCGGEKDLQVDHREALVNGGSPDDPTNLLTACGRCNRGKRTRSEAAWREALARGKA